MIEINGFFTFTMAVGLMISGKILTMNIGILRTYSIPESVVGGFLCAAFVAVLHLLSGRKLQFELEIRDFLLQLFLASVGLKSHLRTLIEGGTPLLILPCACQRVHASPERTDGP